MNERVAKCLLISKVLVADGIMTEAEREFLQRAMTEFGLDADEQRRVIDLDGWDEAEPLVSALSEQEKRDVVDKLAHAALVDGQLSPHELNAVKSISKALGVDSG